MQKEDSLKKWCHLLTHDVINKSCDWRFCEESPKQNVKIVLKVFLELGTKFEIVINPFMTEAAII